MTCCGVSATGMTCRLISRSSLLAQNSHFRLTLAGIPRPAGSQSAMYRMTTGAAYPAARIASSRHRISLCSPVPTTKFTLRRWHSGISHEFKVDFSDQTSQMHFCTGLSHQRAKDGRCGIGGMVGIVTIGVSSTTPDEIRLCPGGSHAWCCRITSARRCDGPRDRWYRTVGDSGRLGTHCPRTSNAHGGYRVGCHWGGW